MESKTNCPMCSGHLKILSLECEQCHTGLTGNFEFPKAGQIDAEIFEFIKIFIYAEGNIKKTESILNCSYPKIKNLLKQAKRALGVQINEAEESVSNQDEKNHILSLLEAGEISFDEAMKRIKGVR